MAKRIHKAPRARQGDTKLVPLSMTVSPEELELYKEVAIIENTSMSLCARTILTRVAKDIKARDLNYKFYSKELPTLKKQLDELKGVLPAMVSELNSMELNSIPLSPKKK